MVSMRADNGDSSHGITTQETNIKISQIFSRLCAVPLKHRKLCGRSVIKVMTEKSGIEVG
jgi:hypothetical protein